MGSVSQRQNAQRNPGLTPSEYCDTRLIITDYLLWGASTKNEKPHRVIQSAFERGLGSSSLEPNPYELAEAVVWLRGYYYAHLDLPEGGCGT